MGRALFGIAVPDATTRITIRPVFGRGPAMPLYESPLAEGDPLPSETDVQIAASRNAAFWEYVDAQVASKRISVPDDGWRWKLRLQFRNNAGTEDPTSTEDAFEFYRAVVTPAGAGSADALVERSLTLLENLTRATVRTNKRMTKACAEALALVSAEATKAIAAVADAAGKALAEASKQTSEVSKVTGALLQETSDLKEEIFKLQTERAKGGVQAPKSPASELKEFMETAKTVIGLAEGLGGGGTSAKPSPAPASGKAGEA